MSYFPGSPPGRSALDRVTPVRADFWRDCDVFVTGHTGFKGAWLAVLLTRLGARVHGYALETPDHFLFHRADVRALLASDVRGDIRDAAALETALRSSGADVVLHLAAQSIVRASYVDPRETFSSNVDGTVAVLDVARSVGGACRGASWSRPTRCYRERRARSLGLPSRSTGWAATTRTAPARRAAELVARTRTAVFVPAESRLRRRGHGRAGRQRHRRRRLRRPTGSCADLGARVLAEGRPADAALPAARSGPGSMVLEPLNGYLTLAEQLDAARHDTSWNFGPSPDDALTVGEIADRVAARWGDGASSADDRRRRVPRGRPADARLQPGPGRAGLVAGAAGRRGRRLHRGLGAVGPVRGPGPAYGDGTAGRHLPGPGRPRR